MAVRWIKESLRWTVTFYSDKGRTGYPKEPPLNLTSNNSHEKSNYTFNIMTKRFYLIPHNKLYIFFSVKEINQYVFCNKGTNNFNNHYKTDPFFLLVTYVYVNYGNTCLYVLCSNLFLNSTRGLIHIDTLADFTAILIILVENAVSWEPLG